MPLAPPPDFRYVGLEPGPSGQDVAALAAGAGVGTFGAGVVLGGGVELGTVALAGAAGAASAALAARGRGRTLSRLRARQVPMAIVPWGVLVLSPHAPRVLRWAAIHEVRVDFVHEMDHATPTTRWSVVTIRTDRELLGGRAHGAVSLERLQAYLDRYAAEAARPVALDLEGQTALDEVLEPAVEQLLAQAQRMLRQGQQAERLSLLPSGYRDPYPFTASDGTIDVLRAALDAPLETPADPRALAAVLAAELRVYALRDPVSKLTTSPHPLVTAVARAAALRLGEDLRRIGGVDEVAEFLPRADLERLKKWAPAAPEEGPPEAGSRASEPSPE